MGVTILELPEPPRQGGGRSAHWRGQWAKLNAYKIDAWAAAVQQVKPSPDPPARVRVSLAYRFHSRRDPPNLYVDAKVVLDTLKQVHPTRDKLRWKSGMFLMRGYFVDDDLLEYGSVSQVVDRENRGVTVTIEVLTE